MLPPLFGACSWSGTVHGIWLMMRSPPYSPPCIPSLQARWWCTSHTAHLSTPDHLCWPRHPASYPAGTLVVHLPTAYEGGQLVVSHAGHSKTLDFAAGSAYGMHYAAFYADCNHEVGWAARVATLEDGLQNAAEVALRPKQPLLQQRPAPKCAYRSLWHGPSWNTCSCVHLSA